MDTNSRALKQGIVVYSDIQSESHKRRVFTQWIEVSEHALCESGAHQTVRPSCIFANFGGLFLFFILFASPQYSYVKEKDNNNNNIYNIE